MDQDQDGKAERSFSKELEDCREIRTLQGWKETHPERWSQVLAFIRVWGNNLSTFNDSTGLFSFKIDNRSRSGFPIAWHFITFDANKDLGKFSITLPINLTGIHIVFWVRIWSSPTMEDRITNFRFLWEESENTWIFHRNFTKIGPCNNFTKIEQLLSGIRSLSSTAYMTVQRKISHSRFSVSMGRLMISCTRLKNEP